MLEPGARHILLLFAIFAHRNVYAADAEWEFVIILLRCPCSKCECM